MKRIILDFLDRWWGPYFIAVLFIGMMDMALDAEASLMFIFALVLPFLSELRRRPFGVMSILPVSKRMVARSYWILAVLLPTLLMAVTFVMAELIHHPSAILLLKEGISVFVGSLVLTGSGFCFFTFAALNDDRDKGNDPLTICIVAFWLCVVLAGRFHIEILKMATQIPGVLIGLFLTTWGYFRAERLFCTRARKLPYAPIPMLSAKQSALPKSRLPRFGGIMFDITWRGLLSGLLYSILIFFFNWKSQIQDDMTWSFTLVIPGLLFGPARLGIRLLRTLPISANQISLNFSVFLPLLSIASLLAGLGLGQMLGLGHVLGLDSVTFLFPMAGAVCMCSSIIIRYSHGGFLGDGYTLAGVVGMAATYVIHDTATHEKWPVVFWWVLGLCLVIGGFFLSRRWLRCSESYRDSGDASPGRLRSA